MTRIFLARAGSTDYDEQHRIAGSLDLPLSPHGESEVDALARELRSTAFDAIYATAGEAALATAKRIGRSLDVKVKQLPSMINQNCGCWQGMQVEELRRTNPRLFKALGETPAIVCPPNGETLAGVLERTAVALKPLLKRHASDTILLVAPDPLRRLIRSYLKKTDVSNPLEDDGSSWETVDFLYESAALAESPPGAVR